MPALALAVGAQAASPTGQPITVTVNGTPVAFTGTPPSEVKGAVLVPLRGVFQALNATVNYNPVTKVINAQKGSATVVLPLGATTATVNGQAQALSQPAQSVGGTTLVPLRFVAQALGAYVQWHADTSTVEIKTAEPHLATLPALPGAGPVEGQVTGVYTDTVPQTITVRVNGRNTSVPISDTTILLRSEVGQPATQVALNQITSGDEVRVQRDAQGNVVSVAATFGAVTGTVKSIGRLPNGDPVITLNDGKTIELTPDAPITMGNRRIGLSDIMASERVVIRTNPTNSLGTGVALATGGDRNPTPPGGPPPAAGNGVAPAVTSFTQDATRPLRAGDVLTATLTGTPGGQASFTIPGVVENVPMREGAAGVYTGAFTIPKNVSVAGAAVLGKVVIGGVSSPLIQASGTVTAAGIPPKVTDLSPARGATVESDRPLIYATVSDAGGIGIDPNATRISLDGADVTDAATVTPVFVSVKPAQPLAAGRHTVRLALTDKAGNTEAADWDFTVSTGKIIEEFTSDASDQGLAAGEAVHFRLTARPGGKASVRIGGLAGDLPLTESQPGVYTGAYTVRAGENAPDTPVTATFVGGDGTKVSASLKGRLTLSGGPPGAPVITEPSDGARVNDPLTISGTATPGATVHVTVSFSAKALGGLFPISGAVGAKVVTADDNGRWTAADLPLRADTLFGGSSDTTFTITATAVDSNGDESPAAKIQVRRK